jgi:beta propeller repeat protein
MRRLILLPLAVFMLSACSDQAPAPTQPIVKLTPAFQIGTTLPTEVRLTEDPAWQLQPAISGDRIVWTDERNGNPDIYLYDLASSVNPIQITDTPFPEVTPAISGDRIVWRQDQNYGDLVPNWDIYMCEYNPATGDCPITAIATEDEDERSPAISGDRIVWMYEAFADDVHMYDLAAETEVLITYDPYTQAHPGIAGDLIVWVDALGGWDVKMCEYNPTTEECPIKEVTDDEARQQGPVVSGNRIAWYQEQPGHTDIYSCEYNPATGDCPITPIAIDPAKTEIHPAISGDRIVWEDRASGATDIYMYDFASPVNPIQITDDPLAQVAPAISGDRIVWMDWRHGNPEIYMLELTPTFGDELMQVDSYLADGSIDNEGIGNALKVKLLAAGAALERGDVGAAINMLNALISQVSAQAGKHITVDAAADLIAQIQALIDSLS